MGILESIELVAAIVWLSVGVYVAIRARRMCRRLDDIIAAMERDVYK